MARGKMDIAMAVKHFFTGVFQWRKMSEAIELFREKKNV